MNKHIIDKLIVLYDLKSELFKPTTEKRRSFLESCQKFFEKTGFLTDKQIDGIKKDFKYFGNSTTSYSQIYSKSSGYGKQDNIPYCLRARTEERFYDEDAYTSLDSRGTESINYSDGSSTTHFGGPCGDGDFDEFGNMM